MSDAELSGQQSTFDDVMTFIQRFHSFQEQSFPKGYQDSASDGSRTSEKLIECRVGHGHVFQPPAFQLDFEDEMIQGDLNWC